jgi:hypothetical protein
MPFTGRKGMKGSVGTVNGSGKHREQSSWDRVEKVAGFLQSASVAIAHNTTSGHGQNQDGRKQPGISGLRKNGKGDGWFQDGAAKYGSQSSARKAASAHIAKIPYALARHIAESWHP